MNAIQLLFLPFPPCSVATREIILDITPVCTVVSVPYRHKTSLLYWIAVTEITTSKYEYEILIEYFVFFSSETKNYNIRPLAIHCLSHLPIRKLF
jgi:hypothetical protein